MKKALRYVAEFPTSFLMICGAFLQLFVSSFFRRESRKALHDLFVLMTKKKELYLSFSMWPLVVVDSKTVSPEGAAVKARVYKFDSRTTKALRADVKAID